MSRKPLNGKAMTAAERQRRRRAKLRTEKPPQKPGRPRLGWIKKCALEIFCENFYDESQHARSARRHHADFQYTSFGKQVLGVGEGFDGYSVENVERYKPLMRKGILEQLGRHAVFLANTVGCEPDEAVTDVRAYADELLKQDGLSVDSVIRFFRWLRKDVPTDEEIENAAR
jgi:hypothetical protein